MNNKARLDMLGDRMKTFERLETDRRMIPGLPIYIRLDGRGFSKFTKQMKRPYDESMSKLMQATTEYLVSEFNATIGYVQSDEISLIINNEYESPAIFEGKIQKLTSTLASSATAFFVSNFSEFFGGKTISDYSARLPSFDCRLFNLPSWGEAANSILWRYLDALKNSKQMLAHHHFSHSELQNHNGKQLVDKLQVEKGIIWADFPDFFKSGVFVKRETFITNENVIRHRVVPLTLEDSFHLLSHEARIEIVSPTVELEKLPLKKEKPKEDLESRIKTFLDDPKGGELAVEFIPLEEFIFILESLGYEKDDYDTNGWQCDFWLYLTKVGCQKLTLSGSLYYGGFTLSKNDDE